MDYLILLVGFGVLLKGADYFVEGSSAIALKLRISHLIVGLTLVAFGTSAPELIVNVLASIQGANSLAFGNIMGSNIANIALVVGLAAIILPLTVRSIVVTREIPFMILSVLVLAVLVFDKILQGNSHNTLTRGDGLILISFFAIFIYYLFSSAMKERDEGLGVRIEVNKDKIMKYEHLSYLKASIYFGVGMIMIFVGSQMVVNSAISIAKILGIGEQFIGLTVVAIGTSLPEVITSITAAIKKEADIAVGNLVGSNIFNIFFVLGITSIISPLAFDTALTQEIVLMLFIFVILFVFSLNKKEINRYEGSALLSFYILYLGFIFYTEFLGNDLFL